MIICICKNNTANHLHFDRQLLGLTLKQLKSKWNLALVYNSDKIVERMTLNASRIGLKAQPCS